MTDKTNLLLEYNRQPNAEEKTLPLYKNLFEEAPRSDLKAFNMSSQCDDD